MHSMSLGTIWAQPQAGWWPEAANSLKNLVGERGFEPPAPASRRRCSTRLSYSPARGVIAACPCLGNDAGWDARWGAGWGVGRGRGQHREGPPARRKSRGPSLLAEPPARASWPSLLAEPPAGAYC